MESSKPSKQKLLQVRNDINSGKFQVEFTEKCQLLQDSYELCRTRANELFSSEDLSLYLKIHGQRASKLYSALSSLIYTSISLNKVQELESYIKKASIQLPTTIFNYEEWEPIILIAQEFRTHTLNNYSKQSSNLHSLSSNEAIHMKKKLEMINYLSIKPLLNVKAEVKCLRKDILSDIQLMNNEYSELVNKLLYIINKLTSQLSNNKSIDRQLSDSNGDVDELGDINNFFRHNHRNRISKSLSNTAASCDSVDSTAAVRWTRDENDLLARSFAAMSYDEAANDLTDPQPLQQQIIELQQIVTELHRKIEEDSINAQKSLEEQMELQAQAFNDEIAALKASKEIAEQEREIFETESRKLESLKDSLVKPSLDDVLAQHQADISDYKTRLEASEEKEKLAVAKVAELEKEVENVKESFRDSIVKSTSSADQAELLASQELEALQQKYATLELEKKIHQEAAEAMKDQLEKFQSVHQLEIVQLQESLSDAAAKVKAAELAEEAVKTELETLKSKELREEISAVASAVSAAQAATIEELEALRSEKADDIEKMKKMQEILTSLTAKLDTTKQEIAKVNEEKASIKQDLEQLKAKEAERLHEANAANESKEKAAVETNNHVSELLSELDIAKKEIDALQQQLEQSKAEILAAKVSQEKIEEATEEKMVLNLKELNDSLVSAAAKVQAAETAASSISIALALAQKEHAATKEEIGVLKTQLSQVQLAAEESLKIAKAPSIDQSHTPGVEATLAAFEALQEEMKQLRKEREEANQLADNLSETVAKLQAKDVEIISEGNLTQGAIQPTKASSIEAAAKAEDVPEVNVESEENNMKVLETPEDTQQDSKEEIDDKTKEIELLKQECESTKKEIAALKEQLTETSAKIVRGPITDTLNPENTNMDVSKSTNSSVKIVTVLTEVTTEDTQKVAQEVEKLKTQLQTSAVEVERLSTKLSESSAKLTSLKAGKTNSSVKEADSTDLSAETLLRNRIEEMEKEVETQNASIVTLREDLAKADASLASTMEDLKANQVELSKVQEAAKETEELETILQSTTATLAEKTAKVKELKTKLASLAPVAGEVDGLNQELKIMKQQLADKDCKLAELQEQLIAQTKAATATVPPIVSSESIVAENADGEAKVSSEDISKDMQNLSEAVNNVQQRSPRGAREYDAQAEALSSVKQELKRSSSAILTETKEENKEGEGSGEQDQAASGPSSEKFGKDEEAVIAMQQVDRSFIARQQVNKIKTEIAAMQQGVLVAYQGTKQGLLKYFLSNSC